MNHEMKNKPHTDNINHLNMGQKDKTYNMIHIKNNRNKMNGIQMYHWTINNNNRLKSIKVTKIQIIMMMDGPQRIYLMKWSKIIIESKE